VMTPYAVFQRKASLINSLPAKLRTSSALLILILAIWLPRFSGPLDFRWDGGVYYILGTALAEGKGYKLLNEPGDIDATQYPPLLPAVIAAHQWILGTSDPIIVGSYLRLSIFVLFNIYIFSIYFLMRIYLPEIYAFLASLICLLNFHTYFLSDLCFPEILFALSTTLFFIYNRNKYSITSRILAAIFAVASYALRTIGISILIAWIAESIFNRQFKRAAFRLIISLIPIVSWQFYISSVESNPLYKNPSYEYQRAEYQNYNISYTQNMSLIDPYAPELGYISPEYMAKRALYNTPLLLISLGDAVGVKKDLYELGWQWVTNNLLRIRTSLWPAYFIPSILGSLILGGIILQFSKRQWVIPFYILTYLASLSITPWSSQFPRYLAPLAPLIALSLLIMLLTLKSNLHKMATRKYVIGCTAFLMVVVPLIILQDTVIAFLAYTRRHQTVVYETQSGTQITYRLFFYNDPYRVFDAALDWLMKQAKPTDIVASSMPHWVYLRTGLKSVMPPLEPDPVKAQQLVDSVPVTYLVLDQGLAVDTQKYTLPVVQNFPEHWKRVYSDKIIDDAIISGAGRKHDGRFEIYQRMDAQISSSKAADSSYP
jgi:hypothetical protein